MTEPITYTQTHTYVEFLDRVQKITNRLQTEDCKEPNLISCYSCNDKYSKQFKVLTGLLCIPCRAEVSYNEVVPENFRNPCKNPKQKDEHLPAVGHQDNLEKILEN